MSSTIFNTIDAKREKYEIKDEKDIVSFVTFYSGNDRLIHSPKGAIRRDMTDEPSRLKTRVRHQLASDENRYIKIQTFSLGGGDGGIPSLY